MNYLQLTQRAVLEGRVQMPAPVSVSGLTGIAADIARWVNEAWEETQRKHVGRMKCLRVVNFTATALTVGDNDYSLTAAAPDLAIANFAQFETGTLYTQKADGSQKTPLSIIPYDEWQSRYKFATFPSGQPTEATLPGGDRIIFNALPDVAYQFKGNLWRSPQTLSISTDTPILPARFHMYIVWEAVKMLAADRENATLYSKADDKALELYNDMIPSEIEMDTSIPLAPIA